MSEMRYKAKLARVRTFCTMTKGMADAGKLSHMAINQTADYAGRRALP